MHLFKKLAKAFMIILLAAVTGFALAGCGGSGASSSSAKAPAAGAAKTPAKPGDKLIIRMLDIGQGDAFLLEKDGKFAMIDTGDVEHTFMNTASRNYPMSSSRIRMPITWAA